MSVPLRLRHQDCSPVKYSSAYGTSSAPLF